MDKLTNDADGIPLVITEADVDSRALSDLRARQVGDQVLGDDVDGVRDVVPGAVLKRVSRVVPLADYDIVDITLKFTLGGEILGIKVGGDVAVKLAPKRGKPAA